MAIPAPAVPHNKPRHMGLTHRAVGEGLQRAATVGSLYPEWVINDCIDVPPFLVLPNLQTSPRPCAVRADLHRTGWKEGLGTQGGDLTTLSASLSVRKGRQSINLGMTIICKWAQWNSGREWSFV